MIITEIVISNWRSIAKETIKFKDLVVLIGQNNHGKSNVLKALLFFFGEIPLDPLDFKVNDKIKEDNLFIEIEFSNLNEDEKRTFKRYVTKNNTLRVRKVASSETGLSYSYHGYIEEPEEEWLKDDCNKDFLIRTEAEKLPLLEFLPPKGRITKEIFSSAQLKYIEKSKASLTFSYKLESSNFLGHKNVASGIFGDIYYVPSIKSASEELSIRGKSIFGQLYGRVLDKMSCTNSKYIEAKEKISELSKLLNKNFENGDINVDRPKELSQLESIIEEEMSAWDAKIDVEITPPNIDDIFKVGATVWIDDGTKTDVSRKGNGLQRMLIFALIKAWALTTKKDQESTDQEAVNEKCTSRKASRSSYFIYEEPELFLHPQAQRELYANLVELSKSGDRKSVV